MPKKGNPNIGELGKKTHFKKGQVANKKGRGKGQKYISTYLKDLLRADIDVINPFTKIAEKLNTSEAIALKLVYKAVIKGDLAAINTIMDRTEGKVANPNININTEEMPITESDEAIVSNFLARYGNSEE